MQALAGHRHPCHVPRQLQPAGHGIPRSPSERLFLMLASHDPGAPQRVRVVSWGHTIHGREGQRLGGEAQLGWPESWTLHVSGGQGWEAGCHPPPAASFRPTHSPAASPSFPGPLETLFFPPSVAFPGLSQNLLCPTASLLAYSAEHEL